MLARLLCHARCAARLADPCTCVCVSLLSPLQLVISEWGLGGGTQDGRGVAPTVADVAGHPFFGLWYPYDNSKNPWRNAAYNDYR